MNAVPMSLPVYGNVITVAAESFVAACVLSTTSFAKKYLTSEHIEQYTRTAINTVSNTVKSLLRSAKTYFSLTIKVIADFIKVLLGKLTQSKQVIYAHLEEEEFDVCDMIDDLERIWKK